MTGFSLTGRQMVLVRGIIDATKTPADLAVPWPALEMLGELLHAETVGVTSLDNTLPRVVIEQWIDPDGSRGWISETASEAERNPFWARYWDPERGCSYPDVTGDYDWVNRASDLQSLRQRRARFVGEPEEFYAGILTGCIAGAHQGRYTRVRAFRSGPDFTDQEVFLLALLKPHVEVALMRSLAAARATPRLTRRQLQVLRMVQAGLTNRQIARRTGLTEGTVHTHLTHIYTRLGVQSRTAAVHRVFDTADAWPAGGPSSQGHAGSQVAVTVSTSATG